MSGEPASAAGSSDAARRGVRNLVVMTGGRLATHVVLVLSVFVIPRLLGAESYGRYAAAMSVVQILTIAASAGLPLVEARFLAPLWRLGDRAAVVELGSTIWLTRLALSALAGGATVAWFASAPQLGFGPLLWVLVGGVTAMRAAMESSRSLFLAVGSAGKMMGFDLARVSVALPVVVAGYLGAGLPGVFGALPVAFGLLAALAALTLHRVLPLRPAAFRWDSLRPHLGYSLANYVGALAGIVQAQFAVFAVASWVAPREAAFLGVAVQLFTVSQGMYVAARRGLYPVLSELETLGEHRRLRRWGGLMMRYGAAILCAATVAWGLLGHHIISFTLTDAFLPAQTCGTWMLLAVTLFSCGASCNGLLYVRGHARAASANLVAYALATMLGLLWVLRGSESGEGVALQIAAAYALASLLFFGVAYAVAAVGAGVRLPLVRTLLLIAPAALAWPAQSWDAALPARVVALFVFLAAYAGTAMALGLLPPREVAELLRRIR